MRTEGDFMSTSLTVLAPDQDVVRAMQILIEARISGAPVVDGHGNLVGILTQRDCLTAAFRASYHGETAGPVADYMSRDVETVPAEMTLIELIERFYRSKRRRFPVLAGGQLVGQISRRDVLQAFVDLI
jgi:CBS domain-containing protein